jgi:mannose-6-phosphate isomerase
MTTQHAHPVKLLPRLDPKPWGGRRLEQWGITLPAGEMVGEALLTAPEAVVASGRLAGATLASLARDQPASWVGARGLAATGGRPIFPLLIKLIDAQADLSIQVHPDDRAAAAAGLGTGKTEAYYVLSAEPGSVIYLGLDSTTDQDDFVAACLLADGSASRCLRSVQAAPGMTVLVPAGTAHALGAGIAIYEIQQPSNVTYRLDDWGRRDERGELRALHHAEGFAVLDPASHPQPIPTIRLEDGHSEREILVATRYFALERIVLDAGDPISLHAVASPRVFTCIEGVAVATGPGWQSSLSVGETLVLPVGTVATLAAHQRAAVMHGWVPDLARDIIAPARAAGATDIAIRQLGIELGAAGRDGNRETEPPFEAYQDH